MTTNEISLKFTHISTLIIAHISAWISCIFANIVISLLFNTRFVISRTFNITIIIYTFFYLLHRVRERGIYCTFFNFILIFCKCTISFLITRCLTSKHTESIFIRICIFLHSCLTISTFLFALIIKIFSLFTFFIWLFWALFLFRFANFEFLFRSKLNSFIWVVIFNTIRFTP